jgi:hypothetical protein
MCVHVQTKRVRTLMCIQYIHICNFTYLKDEREGVGGVAEVGSRPGRRVRGCGVNGAGRIDGAGASGSIRS